MAKYTFSLVVAVILTLSLAGSVEVATRVGGYYRSSGTYVMPHYRTSPNSYRFDNYSSQGNYNPYTGKKGYVSPFKSYKFR